MSFWRSQNINVVITLQVVIPASSVREVKKHNSALSMMSIETADREKVRTILLIHWLFIYLLFSFFSLLLMWSAFDWMLSRKGTFVHIISSLNWKIQLFIMQWYTVLIQSNLSNMKNSHLDLNWINQMSILNFIHSSCCRHWVKLFRRRRWLSPEWMSEYPTQRQLHLLVNVAAQVGWRLQDRDPKTRRRLRLSSARLASWQWATVELLSEDREV